jgi:hypothetical protein
MSTNVMCASLDTFAKTLEPTARVEIKDDSALMIFLNVFAHLFNATFMTGFATTICRTIYIPRGWLGADLRKLMVHECRHITQCRWCGFGLHPWVGFIPYLFLYALFPFFIGVAYFRYRFELDADAAAWRWALGSEVSTPEDIRSRALTFANTVGSGAYLFPWPKSLVLSGFLKKAEEVISEFTDSV